MPKPISAADRNMPPHWKVRIVLPGAIIHLASMVEPAVVFTDRQVTGLNAEWIDGTEHGDTLGFIHWPSVVGITWRMAE